MDKDYLKNKSEYWKKFPDQYTIDEEGNILIHDDADEEVKKSFKQYTYAQQMANYFVEEEEEEEEVERTFTISEEAMKALNEKKEPKKFEMPELKLEKDYSMYSWMSQTQYYKVVKGNYVFNEDTPQEVLDGYELYKDQLSRFDSMMQGSGENIIDYLLETTGINILFKKMKKNFKKKFKK